MTVRINISANEHDLEIIDAAAAAEMRTRSNYIIHAALEKIKNEKNQA